MATALGAAGMGSAPEADIVAQRAGQDPTLQAAYRDQVRSTVKHNLQKHPDFTAEKYPNTAKYFGTPKQSPNNHYNNLIVFVIVSKLFHEVLNK